MTLLAATSTPRPLPRQRGDAEKRPRLSLAGAVPAQPANVKGNNDGLAPSIQKNEAPRARRKAIQTDEAPSETRRDNLSRIEALSIEIRSLTEAIVLGADIELLDLMRDETGSYSRHKAAQEARTWAEQGRLSIETGLMQLERAMRSATIRG
ncbi:hypothetical protein [Paraburkholderia sp. J41]|uniref:hypothetical protein n=1 Tax=Paraburkholderia sp. J41 TaxID=2805433 RepID=UPI002AC31AA7|nr:hypothetical protein [Paraburkholderia sp. J41]